MSRFGATALAVTCITALTTVSSMAVVSGSPSSFESNDGNMTVDATGHSDWNCFFGLTDQGFQDGTAPSCATAVDTDNPRAQTDPAATTSDDSWPNGEKLDTQCAQIATNKNPAKDDFTNVASYHETSSGNDMFLYGATIRVAANGNASENVELSHVAGTSGCPINRTAGDVLLAFDYLNGGTNLNLHVLTWIDSTHQTLGDNNGTCYVSHDSLPCWGAKVISPNGTTYEGESNQDAILAADNAINGKDLVEGQFAEFGVNLTNALNLSTTSCNTFAQQTWESRSSGSSFSSNPEDITVLGGTISNCGEVKIVKQTSPRGADQSFGFSSTLPNSTDTTVASTSSPYCQQDTTPNGTYTGSDDAGFALNDTGNSGSDNSAANTEDCTNVLQGTYTVTEAADPTGFTFDHVSCTGGEAATTGANSTDKTATIVLAPGDVVTCTYVNDQVAGAILITKTGKDANCASSSTTITNGVCTGEKTANLSGATFKITTDAAGNDVVTGASALETNNSTGAVCFDGLTVGTYYVWETDPPNGYSRDSALAKTVSVSTAGTCNSDKDAIATGASGVDTSTSAAPSFSDTPLTTLEVTATGEAAAGTTKSTISCTRPDTSGSAVTVGTSITTATDPAHWNTQHLAPGTYTCTVVIDP